MGAQQSSTTLDENALPSLEDQLVAPSSMLQDWQVDTPLVPGSGRFMKTYRIRRDNRTAVLKTGWVVLTTTDDSASIMETCREELIRLRQVLRDQTHVAPFVAWCVGDDVTRGTGGQQQPLPVRPVYLLRPHFYTTLADRLATRPFLTTAEKLHLSSQLLQAVAALHQESCHHGFLTSRNVCVTATGWLVLVDLTAGMKPVALFHDDPSDFLYYYSHAAAQKNSNAGCYLAPERFTSTNSPPQQLTAAMDMFSVGCVLTEIFLNGETCLELGDLLEYRSSGTSTALQQKLQKIESSVVRAACKHMLQLDPAQRESAAAYWERWNDKKAFPRSFDILTKLLERVTVTAVSADARLAWVAETYEQVLWETVGVRDRPGQAYFARVLGVPEEHDEKVGATSNDSGTEQPFVSDTSTLLAETEALLAQLESLQIDNSDSGAPSKSSLVEPKKMPKTQQDGQLEREERSAISKSSLLIYLQLITATVRHVQRPTSKLVALQLLRRIAKYSCDDDARLQRIVPVTVSLLQDQDALVRASAVQVMTYTLSIVESFPPSDSQIFPQYIFKRVAHLISDPALVARLAFAECIAVLAETAQRFLDISHAVRLYEAVGSGGARPSDDADDNAVFGDEVHKLLDTVSRSSSRLSLAENTDADDCKSETSGLGGRTLIRSTYNAELAGLHETVSRWVVQLTTDQSNHASVSKRAVLRDLGRLCTFFGLDGVMAFILPQILAFLNERKDWELRAALFDQLPSVCYIIGRAASEEFVLPCVEIGLVDSEEQVISRALQCLAELVELGLLSRFALIGNTTIADTKMTNRSLLTTYSVLLLHPSEDIRNSAIEAFSAMCKALGPLDCQVYVIPKLAPLFRFQPLAHSLTTDHGMTRCLDHRWPREKYAVELQRVSSSVPGLPPTPGAWTSIGISSSDEVTHQLSENSQAAGGVENPEKSAGDPQVERFREYLVMLLKHTASFSSQERPQFGTLSSDLSTGIEGSLKLAQNIMFPKQNGREQKGVVPRWYETLRDEVESKHLSVSEDSAIRSVSSLGQVFGLSIMGPASGAADSVVDASDEVEGKIESSKDILRMHESKSIEGAFAGRWGSETTIDPEVVDTCLLVTKLKAMQVPPLPPQLGGEISSLRPTPVREHIPTKSWKPNTNAMVATSSPVNGHTAPVVRLAVSGDQRFFVSGSHDGTCRVWEIPRIEESPGILDSSTIYSGHSSRRATRINDIAMLEGSHSLVSGASDGSVHVWRVDSVSSTPKNPTGRSDSSKVVGTSSIRKAEPREGEVLAVSHFNSASASVITFATQKGVVHSWDLRSAQEPFALRHSASLGNLTALALGSDRNWLVTGTSSGYVALWDIRFQQPVKLWQHSRGTSISRLATSYILPPQYWGSDDPSLAARPFIFIATGSNECGMFDVLNGSCQGCFRTIEADSRTLNGNVMDPPMLEPVRISPKMDGNVLKSLHQVTLASSFPSASPINCMVGSVGTGNQSYLITGGSDSMIRYWDFAVPSKCFVVSGQSAVQPRPSYERIDFDGNRRLMLCRESVSLGLRDTNSMPRRLFHGLKKPEHYHSDSIQDLKVIDNSSLISCSRDCTVKIWR